ncbi:MAG: peptide-methionine (S)-S-oxide reductase MsrA [Chthoniobacterales bacterium]|nr:peptide-methionine (S)-S-oxide reductase MsrA [Chthoniobacterales bacterium]
MPKLITAFFIFMTLSSFAVATDPASSPTEQATLGGGCFWCTEALFQKYPGVISVKAGFAGGTTKNPTYEEVCSGKTGHAEVIQITYDPKKVSYDQLLDLFWRAHDPTTWNSQGADQGPQYRSIILTNSPEQEQLAEASKKKAQACFSKPIVTEIKLLIAFYPADEHHQDYYLKNSNAPYCQLVIAPKLEKLNLKK